jgi:cytoskeletal protein CcmA (bactofilin family)
MAKDEFTAFLGAGTEYQGQLNFKGTVRVDCRFLGDITSDGKLILGKEARVDGIISVKELVVHGILTGNSIVTKRTILHQHARVTGTLTTPALVMEEGALLQGELRMGKDAALDETAGLPAQTDHGMPVIDASVKQ